MPNTVLSRVIAWALARRPVRAFLVYSGARGPMLADSVTYRTLFSLFAGILLGFSVAALWLAGNPDAWQALIRALDAAIPGIGDVIDFDKVTPLSFGIAGIVSAVGLIGSAIGAIGSLRNALRSIAGLATDDVLWIWVLLRNLVLAIALGVGLVAAAAATFLATAGLTLITDWLGVDRGGAEVLTWLVSVLVVFALDTVVVAAAVRFLSGVRARPRTLWAGALLGGLGLTVLQQLSGLFVGGASANPLLGTFAALVALLLWLNLSSQVILIAGAYVVVGAEEDEDRVHARFGARTLAQFRVQRAERAVAATAGELDAAREAAAKEREAASESAQR